jgi:ubiquinone biosynthesis protein
VFFNQVFRDGYFHGDMHPGNTMIEPDGTIVALDFGIMGRISLERRRQLAQILVGFLERDYGMVTESFVAAGFLPEHADLDGFRLAVRAIGEPIMGRPLAEISFGRLLGQILGVAERFEMRALPELLLLQKTMVVAEGVGRGLNPNVNMWQIAQPLVADWMVRNLGPAARLQAATGDWLDAAARLPGLLAQADRALAAPPAAPPPVPPPRALAIALWAVAAGLFILALAIVTMGS